jgi:hypothetical protein
VDLSRERHVADFDLSVWCCSRFDDCSLSCWVLLSRMRESRRWGYRSSYGPSKSLADRGFGAGARGWGTTSGQRAKGSHKSEVWNQGRKDALHTSEICRKRKAGRPHQGSKHPRQLFILKQGRSNRGISAQDRETGENATVWYIYIYIYSLLAISCSN